MKNVSPPTTYFSKKVIIFSSFFLIILLTGFYTSTISSLLKDLKPIFDGRLSLTPTKLSSSEESLINDLAIPAADIYWADRDIDLVCDTSFVKGAVDITQGSFTRPGANQKAILYRYCTTGHNMSLNGIVVIENSKIVAHVVYQGTWDNAIGELPDINCDSLSELIIASAGSNQGITWKSFSIIELLNNKVIKFGGKQIYSDNYGQDETNCSAEASKIYVRPGNSPAFYYDSFTNKGPCNEKRPWKRNVSSKAITLDNDDSEYSFIK